MNEGFASWMASRTTDKLHPEWHVGLDAVAIREGAMGVDSVVTSHPIVRHIETEEQANQAFDTITYSKGGVVIRMLENYVGANTWRNGVRRYIKDQTYSNTVTDDYPFLAYTSLDPAMVGKLQAYAQAHIAPTSRHDSNDVIANIQYRIGVRKNRLSEIDEWLKKNG